ncbi:mariner Mos1 transposase [Trichonephila clavipes]|nr:mariner Mos1 transposase [Trichonephila clavipes]
MTWDGGLANNPVPNDPQLFPFFCPGSPWRKTRSRRFSFGRVSACIAFFYCVENVEFYAFRPRFADSINFLLPSEENAAESHQMLVEAYGGNALSRAQCYRWFEKFQNGDFNKKRQHKVIFLDDNAPSHRAKPIKDIFKALGWEPLAHASYSPDLAPSNYHLFASLGHALADPRFTSYKNVKSWLDDWLASKDRSFFWSGIRKLPERGEKV